MKKDNEVVVRHFHRQDIYDLTARLANNRGIVIKGDELPDNFVEVKYFFRGIAEAHLIHLTDKPDIYSPVLYMTVNPYPERN